jgi:hypothetical protein
MWVLCECVRLGSLGDGQGKPRSRGVKQGVDILFDAEQSPLRLPFSQTACEPHPCTSWARRHSKHSPAWLIPVISAFKRMKLEAHCEFKASLVT